MTTFQTKTLWLSVIFVFMTMASYAQEPNSKNSTPLNTKHAHICSGHHPPPAPKTYTPAPRTASSLKSAMINSPTNVQVVNESPNHIHVSWDAPSDCNACTYVVLLDTNGNPSDGSYYYVGNDTKTEVTVQRSSLSTQPALGQNFNVYISAYQSGQYSAWTSPVTTSFKWEQLGATTNNITYIYQGWTTQQKQILQNFIARMKPIIHSIYGPPATGIEVTILCSQISFPGIMGRSSLIQASDCLSTLYDSACLTTSVHVMVQIMDIVANSEISSQ